MEVTNKIFVKWSGKEYEIELTENDTVLDLKNAIEKETGVRPERQRLLNLKLKGLGGCRLAELLFGICFRENTR